MSAVVESHRNDLDVSYAVDFSRDREPVKQRSRFPEYRRTGSAPARVNGMHCRRSKRWTWGSGRGARMQNARAFAGCLAVALASVSASVLGVTIDYAPVNNAGNPANPATGIGAVSSLFNISKYETTNSQYADFLNSVDAAGTNPNSVYQPSAVTSGTTFFNPITFNAGASSGAKYSVGGGNATKGVTFVSWFSAARFANWLNNGQQSSSASMETGAYTLSNQTSGAAVARNPGASVFLPNADEWTKATFFNAATVNYRQFPYKGGGTAPTAVTSGTGVLGTNVANYGAAQGLTTGLTNVGLYANAKSWYGLYDAFGNAGEFTETVSATSPADRVMLLGSSWRLGTGGVGSWTSNTASNTYLTSNFSDSMGFRVAAVPEPATIALAGVGIVSLAGLDWLKRRKRKAVAQQASVSQITA